MTQTRRADRDDDVDHGARRSARRVVVVAFVVAVLAVGTWVVAFSSVLGAKRVLVHGTHQISVARVRAAGAVPHGAPLVRLDSGAVAARVEALPGVASARVEVSYPSTVVITIRERVAVGYLTAGGSAVLVDETGKQFRTVSTVPHALPRFDLPSGAQAAPTGQAVATVAGSLTPALLAKLKSVTATGPLSITLLLTDGRTVRWGSSERSADKARVLPALLTRPGTSFDVSDPDVVVAR
jgi:cell division protein FtsQ